MFGFLSLPMETAITSAFYIATTLSMFAWIRYSKQTRVPDNRETIQRVFRRLGVIFATLLLLCYFTEITTWVPIAVLAILMLAGTLGGSVLGAPAIGFLYAVQQYVLGFPDRDEFLLAPPVDHADSTTAAVEQQGHDIGREGITMSPLKPSGEILLDEKKRPAMSQGSRFIEAGQSVIVQGQRNGVLVVAVIEQSAGQ